MKITMIGAGYVGLVSGVCFSDFGHDVVCVDKDAGKIAKLEAGEIPIYEPGLDAIVAKNSKADRLHFTTDLDHVIFDPQTPQILRDHIDGMAFGDGGQVHIKIGAIFFDGGRHAAQLQSCIAHAGHRCADRLFRGQLLISSFRTKSP